MIQFNTRTDKISYLMNYWTPIFIMGVGIITAVLGIIFALNNAPTYLDDYYAENSSVIASTSALRPDITITRPITIGIFAGDHRNFITSLGQSVTNQGGQLRIDPKNENRITIVASQNLVHSLVLLSEVGYSPILDPEPPYLSWHKDNLAEHHFSSLDEEHLTEITIDLGVIRFGTIESIILLSIMLSGGVVVLGICALLSFGILKRGLA